MNYASDLHTIALMVHGTKIINKKSRVVSTYTNVLYLVRIPDLQQCNNSSIPTHNHIPYNPLKESDRTYEAAHVPRRELIKIIVGKAC